MADAKELPTSADDQCARPGNLAGLVSWRGRALRWALAFVLGAVSSVVFAPLEFGWAAWAVLVPLLFMVDRNRRGHFGIGYWWGFGHYLFCLAWLKEVIFPAPLGVGLICAVFPALFAWLAGVLLRTFRWMPCDDLAPKNGKQTIAVPLPCPWRQMILTIALASTWCAVEWLRATFYTGFPWNQFGVSQWSTASLLPLVAFTGVYGLSFLIAAVNVGVFLGILPWLRKDRTRWQAMPTGLALALVMVAVVIVCVPKPVVPTPDKTMAIACIQGNIPQMRVPTDEQAELAKNVYWELTQDAAQAATTPELIIWPETALPWPQFKPNLDRDGPPSLYLGELLSRTRVPMLIGSLDYRADGDELKQVFNSAILVDADGTRLQTYDKMKAVPFGEFLPFVDYYPKWFEKMLRSNHLFMRSLSTGKDYTVFRFKDARIGANICYEDVFSSVSRHMALNGANLLLTITNDAWYNKTSGSHQHMVHAVFRAVETGRPMLRSGNNSDTCLILPDGTVTERLVGPGGDPFHRGFKVYHIPVYETLPETFFMAHGDVFVWVMAAISAIALLYCLYRALAARKAIIDNLKLET